MLIYIIALAAILYLQLTIPPERQIGRVRVLGLWVLFVALVCGIGDMLGGYDRYIYGEIFDATADDRVNGIPIVASAVFEYADKEQGYALYNYLMTFVTSNRYIFILITTLLMYAAFYRHVLKYSKYPITAFFLLFCIYYFFTFTYFRQVMAVCVAWFAIPYAIQRRPIPFFAIMVLAMSFHNSALLFAGVYFVGQYRFSRRQIVIGIVLSLLIGLTPLSSALFSTIGETINEEKTELSVNGASNARFAYIVQAVFFLFFILRYYHRLGTTPMSRCMVNIALGFIFILCFFVRFQDGGRMSWYYLIGIFCTMAEIMGKQSNKVIWKHIMMLVVVVLYIRVLIGWGIQLRPYKTFLTDGVRNGDVIWENYEYDHKYDNHKLYRPIWGGLQREDMNRN